MTNGKVNTSIMNTSGAAHCGTISATVMARTNEVVESNGQINIVVATEGNDTDNKIKLNLVVSTDGKRSAGQTLLNLAEQAKAEGQPAFCFRVNGLVEAELAENKVGKEVALELNVGATQIMPSYPDLNVEPLQNSALLIGTIKRGKYGCDLVFGHVMSEAEDDVAPASLPFANKAASLLASQHGKPVLVSCTINRQTDLDPDNKDYSPYDKLSISPNEGGVTEILLSPAPIRYKSPKKETGVNVGSFEGWGSAKADPAVMQQMLDSMDF